MESHRFTREQRDKFARLDPIRISNLTYFKTSDMGKKQLLTWYGKSDLKDKVTSLGKTWVGIFPKLFQNYLDEIVRSATSKRASVHLTTNFAQVQPDSHPNSYQDDNRTHSLNVESTTYELIKIFEHVNFFNLFLPEPKDEEIERRDANMVLYWQITQEMMQKEMDAKFQDG